MNIASDLLNLAILTVIILLSIAPISLANTWPKQRRIYGHMFLHYPMFSIEELVRFSDVIVIGEAIEIKVKELPLTTRAQTMALDRGNN